jgi:hypothetical protein
MMERYDKKIRVLVPKLVLILSYFKDSGLYLYLLLAIIQLKITV